MILLGEGREIDIGVGKIDTLLGRYLAIVAGADSDGFGVDDLEDIECEDTVIDVDDSAGFNDFGNVLVVNIPIKILAL